MHSLSVAPQSFCQAAEPVDRYPHLDCRPWPLNKKHSADRFCRTHPDWLQSEVDSLVWPDTPVVFICDLHADAQALIDSLVLAGAIEPKVSPAQPMQLTEFGQRATFVIGGDCLDKGPSNLALLRRLRELLQTGARVKLLAGNHDIRLWMGLRSLQLGKDVTTEHMFLRMGEKVIPLFREIYEQYLLGQRKRKLALPTIAQCRQLLFPSDAWFDEFPLAAKEHLSEAAISRELKRMRRKYNNFEACCAEVGLDLQDIYLIAQQCLQLFLAPKGEFSWFFQQMQLVYQTGSIVYLHAGLDDQVASQLAQTGVTQLNTDFRQQMHDDLFRFYYGPVANVVRTKYRRSDLPLSEQGSRLAKQAGIGLLLHGHINRRRGQRLSQQHQLLHLEADVTLDSQSRLKEGLQQAGAGAVIILPQQQLFAVSSDFPYAKVLTSQASLQQTYA